MCELDFKIWDVAVVELLHFIFDTGSVLFNWNLQEQNASIVSLRQLNSYSDAENTSKNWAPHKSPL